MSGHPRRLATRPDPTRAKTAATTVSGHPAAWQPSPTPRELISDILRKLELRDRAHAVAYAHLTGFASLP